MRTSFHHQSEAQPPNGTLTAATSPDTPSLGPEAGGSSPSSQPTEVPKSLTISTQFAGIFAGPNAGRAVSAAG
jgi:hypothetical protein